MKQTIMLLVVLLLVSCGQRKDGKTTGSQRMTTEVLLKTTPVKNQGHSELCWDYAMLATIETEHLMQATPSTSVPTTWRAGYWRRKATDSSSPTPGE